MHFVRLAAGRPTQAGDASDHLRDRWNAAIVCSTYACFRWLIQLDCRQLSTLTNHLLKGTPNSAIDWIQVRAVWGTRVRLDEREVLTPQVRRCVSGSQGHREFPFGNSRESRTPKFPAGIPGNFWNSGGNYGEFMGVLLSFQFLSLIMTLLCLI